jgi:hypothetical protein
LGAVPIKPAPGGTAATFDIDEDTELIDLAKNTNTRVRFLVSNSGAATASNTSYQLEFAEAATCSSGSYSAVPASAGAGDKWEIVDSTHYTDPTATEDITDGVDNSLPNPGGMTFVEGDLRDDNSNSTGGITLDQNRFTEIEFTILATNDALDGTHYCFRLTDSGTDLDSYSYYAEVTLSGTPPNSAPTLTVDEPDGTGDTVSVGDNYSIQYDLADTDDVVTVAFYYDTDNSGYDGTAITGACASGAEGTDATCSWDTTGMTPGTYYVYGVTNDGTNPDVRDYSPGQITIINTDHFIVTSSDNTPTAGVPFDVTITAKDSSGVTVTNYDPTGKTFTFSGPGNAPDSTAPLYPSNAAIIAAFTNGVATVSITLYNAEVVSLDVSDGTYDSTGDTTWDADLTVSANPTESASDSTISFGPDNVEADGVAITTITVTVKDQYGNPIPGILADNVVLSATGTGNTLTQPTVDTNAAGQTTGTLASTVAEGKTISADINTTTVTSGDPTVTFVTTGLVATGVSPGWSNNRKRAVFYNGDRFFLLYYKGGETQTSTISQVRITSPGREKPS